MPGQVNSRAERLEHSQAQVSAGRAEIRSLENQLAIASNQMALRGQENADLATSDLVKGTQLASATAALEGREERLDAAARAVAEAREEAAASRKELAAMSERLGVAEEGCSLLEQQLTASRQRGQLLETEVRMSRASERSARAQVSWL